VRCTAWNAWERWERVLVCFLVTPGQVKSKARLNHSGRCGLLRIFAFRDFRFWQTSCSGEQRVTLTTRSISTASVRRRIAAIPGTRNTQCCALFRLNSRVEIRQSSCSLGSWPSTHHVPGRLEDGARIRCTRAAHPASAAWCMLNLHTARRRPSLAVGLVSSLLRGQLAMKQEGTQANRE